MSFRKIRPSFGDSSSSTVPSQTTSESTGSDPRRVRAEKETEITSSTSAKRRRVPDSVTRNACLNCKKARAKVSGRPRCGVTSLSGSSGQQAMLLGALG